MEHTLPFKRELKKLNNIPEQYLILSDLMAVGHDAVDAYIVAYPENSSMPEKQQRSILDGILQSAKFKRLLEQRKSRIKEGVAAPVSLEDIEDMDSDTVAREILRTAYAFPVGSKERAELLIRYDDIRKQNSAKEEADEMDAITFAFPIKCNQCPLFQAWNELRAENGDPEVRATEMEGVIRKAIKKAIPNATEAYEALHGRTYKEDIKVSTTY